MWTTEMSDFSFAPVQKGAHLRVISLTTATPNVEATSPSAPAMRHQESALATTMSIPSQPAATTTFELNTSVELPFGVELDMIPFTGDGAILIDDLPQVPPPLPPKEAAHVTEEKEPAMDTMKPFGFDPHPKTEQTRIKEAARVYEEERVISNAPRPEPVKPIWEQPAPTKASFDALNDAEIAEILD
jgi:hypothetical protein